MEHEHIQIVQKPPRGTSKTTFQTTNKSQDYQGKIRKEIKVTVTSANFQNLWRWPPDFVIFLYFLYNFQDN